VYFQLSACDGKVNGQVDEEGRAFVVNEIIPVTEHGYLSILKLFSKLRRFVTKINISGPQGF